MFTEKELSGYSLNDSVSDLYIPLIGLPILRSQTHECVNED